MCDLFIEGRFATIRMAAALGERLNELRFEPIAKRIRAGVAGDIVLDTTRAILVWEPKRVVPLRNT